MDNFDYLEDKIYERLNHVFTHNDVIKDVFTASLKKAISKNVREFFYINKINDLIEHNVSNIFESVFEENFHKILEEIVKLKINEAIKLSFDNKKSFSHQLSGLLNQAIESEVLKRFNESKK